MKSDPKKLIPSFKANGDKKQAIKNFKLRQDRSVRSAEGEQGCWVTEWTLCATQDSCEDNQLLALGVRVTLCMGNQQFCEQCGHEAECRLSPRLADCAWLLS